MQRLSVVFSKLDSYFKALKLDYFLFFRLLIGFVFFEILVEHFIDAEFISITSAAYVKSLHTASDHRQFLVDSLLGSPDRYRCLIALCSIFTILYCTGIGSAFVIWIFLVMEWLFQLVSAGNLFGHEISIHQILLLIILVELGQGRIKLFKSQGFNWKPSLVSGLSIALLRLQVPIIYFVSGLGKILSPGWKSPDILKRIFLNSAYPKSLFDSLFVGTESIQPYLAWGIQIFLLSFPLLLIFKKSRKWAFLGGVLFHILIAWKIEIYFFSLYMTCLYLIYLEKDKTNRSANQITS